MSRAQEILARLRGIGAQVVCDGDRLRLRAAEAPIPKDLVAAMRAERAAIIALLATTPEVEHPLAHVSREDAPATPIFPDSPYHKKTDEHLRAEPPSKPAGNLDFAEDAQMSTFDEHLRAEAPKVLILGTLGEPNHLVNEHLRPEAPKMLTQGAQMSTFAKDEDLCGSNGGQAPKVLTSFFVVGKTPRKDPGEPAAPEPYETKSSATVDYRLRSRLCASEDKGASEPPPYEVLGPSSPGERCTLCGGGRDVERIRYGGEVRLWHRACAAPYVAAADPPVPAELAAVTDVTADAAPSPAGPAAVAARAAELLAAAETSPGVRITDRAKAALYFRGRAALELAPERLDPTIHRMRPPDWSDPRDEPVAGDRCSTCRGSQWWTEGGLTKLGWRCCRCRPPHTAIGVHRVQT